MSNPPVESETQEHCGQPMRYEAIADGDVFDGQKLTGTFYCERCQTMNPTYVRVPSSVQVDAEEPVIADLMAQGYSENHARIIAAKDKNSPGDAGPALSTITKSSPVTPPLAQWQPIETAPKDATWIRLLLRSGKVVRSHFGEDLSGEEQPKFSGWFTEGGYKGGFIEVDSPPTHWAPGEPLPPSSEYQRGMLEAAEIAKKHMGQRGFVCEENECACPTEIEKAIRSRISEPKNQEDKNLSNHEA